MKARFFDWIWHIKGSVPLDPAQSSDDTFSCLRPLFRQTGTSHERKDDTLTFRKRNPAAQDKLSIFDRGVLQIEKGAAGPVLSYHLSSKALLFCFFAPLLFLAFAQATVAIGEIEKAATEASAKKPEKKDVQLPQNPIDKWLGAPAPEKPKKDKGKKDDDKHSPTASYIFAGIFAALYMAGRILEDRLVRKLFKKSLSDS